MAVFASKVFLNSGEYDHSALHSRSSLGKIKTE